MSLILTPGVLSSVASRQPVHDFLVRVVDDPNDARFVQSASPPLSEESSARNVVGFVFPIAYSNHRFAAFATAFIVAGSFRAFDAVAPADVRLPEPATITPDAVTPRSTTCQSMMSGVFVYENVSAPDVLFGATHVKAWVRRLVVPLLVHSNPTSLVTSVHVADQPEIVTLSGFDDEPRIDETQTM